MTEDYQADIDTVNDIPAVGRILDLACRTTGMGFAVVARVTSDRWIACQVVDTIGFGLPAGGELKVETTLCHEVRTFRAPIVIDDVATDLTYKSHHTPALYGFRSYISVPIVLPDGSFFGTLCAIDPKPAPVNRPETLETFRLFADLIGFHLHDRRELDRAQTSLQAERDTADLREQFIAVLGHDLRNPLASIAAGADLIARTRLDDRAERVLPLMQSAVERMNTLIGNLMDFARGRLGGGISLEIETACLAPALEHVVAEIRVVVPDRAIETEFLLEAPFTGDHGRIAQVLSNLLANAITHGAADAPVRIVADSRHGLTLSVTNSGPAIEPAAQEMLFRPFTRGRAKPHQQGLGLGLFIASEIARAHGGTLSVTSAAEETCFTLSIPRTA